MVDWLRCRSVKQGQFPGEYAIEASISDGRVISMFAPEEAVQPDKGLVRVDVLDASSDAALVFLPARPIEVSSRTVRVAATELSGPR
jgi:hypothetical protein